MRWFLLNVIGTSIGLGTMLITVFDSWMRGYSILWWVILALLSIVSILINALMLVVRIDRSVRNGPGCLSVDSESPFSAIGLE
ncbi:hypothetical protein [Bradyrhizobium centrosematis]|uniref:hypothetical protein n=1 Tax=Bradyrhizobium centrosematis TaxID=1300039 RepID=UPI002169263B|nr:hypothetical protein [Bradyrhizobium centrosematis]MCS3758739.1 uncharacterized protein (DUF58 family) [Bradyrhizobium centrosematis]MCS3773373.1 uncharacterized protein (DUF58 family) [Bradyrhizobium centrosematis]